MREGAQMGNLNELESDRTMAVNLELSLESMPVASELNLTMRPTRRPSDRSESPSSTRRSDLPAVRIMFQVTGSGARLALTLYVSSGCWPSELSAVFVFETLVFAGMI